MKRNLEIITFLLVVLSICLVTSCDESKVQNVPTAINGVVSVKIVQASTENKAKQEKKISKQTVKFDKLDPAVQTNKRQEQKITAHYDSSGKVDPFKALIQEKPELPKASNKMKPERILTPLEKIELSQIRLVAVIITKSRRIAMVEEASGKGYEVMVGTFIGKNQGRITQIKDDSIVVKEPIKDLMGKFSERIQEVKIHKDDLEE